MKKFLTVLIVVLIGAAAFGVGYFRTDYSIKNSSMWEEVGNSEFSMTIPKTMEEGADFYTSAGQESVASYSNSKAAVSISKIPYSVAEQLKDIDIKLYMDTLTINGNKLTAQKIGDGYYVTYTQSSRSGFNEGEELYTIEGVFQGKTAMYSVTICCKLDDKSDYKEYMLDWLESFKLKK